jgi:hypothetical protein
MIDCTLLDLKLHCILFEWKIKTILLTLSSKGINYEKLFCFWVVTIGK